MEVLENVVSGESNLRLCCLMLVSASTERFVFTCHVSLIRETMLVESLLIAPLLSNRCA